jgi:rhodanese-related sulfurtransferase
MDSSTLINIAIGILVFWFAYTRLRPTKGLRTLRDADFQSEMKLSTDRLLIDVREPSEFTSGSIPGAKNIPLSQLSGRLGEIPKDSRVFLYCRSGMRSKNAARTLSKNGYTKLAHLNGGISAWTGKITK